MKAFKYVVLYEERGVWDDVKIQSHFYADFDDAAKFADRTPGSRLYGLNPEYEYEVNVTGRPKR